LQEPRGKAPVEIADGDGDAIALDGQPHDAFEAVVRKRERSALQREWHRVGAQTERRGDAGPVRGLLGGKDLTGRYWSAIFESPAVREISEPAACVRAIRFAAVLRVPRLA
jgi:hypothetical protein